MIPFLPFAKHECTVDVYRSFHEFAAHVRQDINTREEVKAYVSHYLVSMSEDRQNYQEFVEQYCVKEEGARCFRNAAKAAIELAFAWEYSMGDELVTNKGNKGSCEMFF